MSMGTSELDLAVRQIKRIQFGVFSPEEIRNQSVTDRGIEHAETMEAGRPKYEGLLDPRMGPCDRNDYCMTCKGNLSTCPGHFGHIELAMPVYHICFINTVVSLLNSVCFYCSKPRLSWSHPKVAAVLASRRFSGHDRFFELHRLMRSKHVCCAVSSSKKNPTAFHISQSERANKENLLNSVNNLNENEGCGRKQPRFLLRGFNIYAVSTGRADANDEAIDSINAKADAPQSAGANSGGATTDERYISPDRVVDVFKNISDDDLANFGFDVVNSRPDWYILSVIPVPPICVRPVVTAYGGCLKSQDDLTHKLADIVKTNTLLLQKIKAGAAQHVVNQDYQLLMYHVATLYDNDLPGVPRALQKSGRPLKSLKQRLKGKEGRIRGNLMGKRVDFSARTVITPDPNLSIDQVGCPVTIAQNLTVPEIVNSMNIKRMQFLVAQQGPECYPGAKYLIDENGERIDLRMCQNLTEIRVREGNIVERHLVDDDIVIFNRQPTLHKMSMMGHRVKVLPWSTFRLNLSVTTPYNADFDGDEMNMHVPQTLLARAEIMELAMVPRMVVTPQSNRPVMGIVQDALTALYKITRKDVFIEKKYVMNILLVLDLPVTCLCRPAIVKPKPLWTGKQLFSLIIPSSINYIGEHSTFSAEEDSNEADTRVVIKCGQLLTGMLCKKTMGTSSGSLIHIIALELSSDVTKKFFGDSQKLSNNWLAGEGHSIGINDCIADFKTYKNIQQSIFQAKDEVMSVIRMAHNNQLLPTPGNSVLQTFENEVNRILNSCRDKTGSSAQSSLTDSNNFKIMVVAGSKGSKINISQVIAVVGQQNVEGKRIPYGFSGGRRTLPHFLKDDYGPESRGFVENSYLSGLTPSEFFFHAMAGREGVIDTAVKTSETGYIQRRLMKAMESVMVYYDGTVRNSDGSIIQFVYGEDGCAGEHVEFVRLETAMLGDAAFSQSYCYDIKKNANYEEDNYYELIKMCQEEYAVLVGDRAFLRKLFNFGTSKIALPVNIKRIVLNAKSVFVKNETDISVKFVILCNAAVENYIRNFDQKKKNVPLEQFLNDLTEERFVDSTNFTSYKSLFMMYYRMNLCLSQVKRQSIGKQAFLYVISEVVSRYIASRIPPGEMVGALAAQSLGEPATQMTLNTFHYAGVSAKNVTLGVPRLKEIINVAKVPKTPSLTIFLKEAASGSEESAKNVLNSLEYTTFSQIVLFTSILYDPELTSVIESDNEFISDFVEAPDFDQSNFSSWVLRIVFDRKKFVDKQLTMSLLVEKVYQFFFNSNINIMHSDDNCEVLVMRIRIVNNTSSNLINIMATAGEENEEGAEQDKTDHELILKVLENYIMNGVVISGIPSIKKVYLNKPTNDVTKKKIKLNSQGELVAEAEWILETDGNGLLSVLSKKDVDSVRTTSNDICEIYNVLGIEAARKALERELKHVISFDGSYVNYRHLALLCDIMTHCGYLMPISRHGVNRINGLGPIMKSTFEQALDVLVDAATFSECDKIKGVSEHVMLGKTAPIGTGAFSLMLDPKKCTEAISTSANMLNTFLFANSNEAACSSVGGMIYDKGGETPGFMSPSQMYLGGAPNYMNTPGGAFSPTNNDNSSMMYSYSGNTAGMASPYMNSPFVSGGYYGRTPTSGYARLDSAPASPTLKAAGMFTPNSNNYAALMQAKSPSVYEVTDKIGGNEGTFYSPTSTGVYSKYTTLMSQAAYSPKSPGVGMGAGIGSPSEYKSPQSTNFKYSPISPYYNSSNANNKLYSPMSPGARPGSNVNNMYSPISPGVVGAGYSYSPMSRGVYSPGVDETNNNNNNGGNGEGKSLYSPNNSMPKSEKK